jgi:hypothetical protein
MLKAVNQFQENLKTHCHPGRICLYLPSIEVRSPVLRLPLCEELHWLSRIERSFVHGNSRIRYARSQFGIMSQADIAAIDDNLRVALSLL